MSCGCGSGSQTTPTTDYTPTFNGIIPNDSGEPLSYGNGCPKKLWCNKCFLFWALIFVVAIAHGRGK